MSKAKDDERQKYVAKVRAYLERALIDQSLSLSYEAIAKGAQVSRTQLADHQDPLIGALLLDIQAARDRRAGTPLQAEQAQAEQAQAELTGLEGGGDARRRARDLSDQELAARLQHATGEVGRLMRVWLGHHRRMEAVTDAPLALHDLEGALVGLQRLADVMRPLVAEQRRRTSGSDTLAEKEPTQPGLDLR